MGDFETIQMNDLSLEKKIESWISSGRQGDYVYIQAYLPPSEKNEEALEKLMSKLVKRAGLK